MSEQVLVAVVASPSAVSQYQQEFLVACYDGQLEKLAALLSNKKPTSSAIDINANFEYYALSGGDYYYYYGKTFNGLMLAAFQGHLAVVEFLAKQRGVNLNAKNDAGCNALLIATQQDHIKIVDFLLQSGGINVNDANDKQGRTALMEAADKGYDSIVDRLLQENGVDINAKDAEGMTALMFASRQGHMRAVEILTREPGISLNERNAAGQTALKLAVNHRVRKYLRRFGATE